MAVGKVTGQKLVAKGGTKSKNQKSKPVDPIEKPGKKRSATAAGLNTEDSGPGGKRERALAKIIPRYFKTFASREAHSGSEDGRTIKVMNLPNIEEKTLSKNLLGLLKKQGQIVNHGFQIIGSSKLFKVVFKTSEAALASKELNGTLLEDRHLCISHADDGFRHMENKIVIDNLPEDADDEFLWKTFGDCGKIYSIFRKRGSNQCVITFETIKGKRQALSSPKKYKNMNLSVKEYGEDKWWKTVFVVNLSEDVTKDDVQKFVKKVGPVHEIHLHSRLGCASVEFKNQSDVVKAFPLNGKSLNGQNVEILVHDYTHSQLKENKKSKQETAAEEEEDDDDDDNDEEEEEEEDEEDGDEEEDEDGDEEEDEDEEGESDEDEDDVDDDDDNEEDDE